ncbi:MAG: hypothetical protein KF832_03575 [Caldilineaceae bacterium]|nr:hypothetical protein [Caldilineaceae bacterium]
MHKSFAWQPGPVAVYALLLVTWLLIGLAYLGWFQAGLVVVPLLLVALVASLFVWWQQPAIDRWIMVGIAVVGLLLYTPPAEHIPLFGDAAIYTNEAAYLVRTGGIRGTYEPLAALSPALREPFYVASTEQFPNWRIRWAVQSYEGMLYGGYYLTDLVGPTLQVSRLPLGEVWLALWIKLVGIEGALYNTPIWSIGALLLLYLTARQFVQRPLALWATVLLAVSYPQIYFSRAPYSEIPGQFWMVLGFYFALRWLTERKPWQFVTLLLCWTTTWAGRIDALLLLGAIGILCLIAATARDKRSLGWAAAVLPLCAGFVLLSANRPYIGATYELIALRWSWFGLALVGLGLALPVAILLFWWQGSFFQRWLQRLAPLLQWLAFAGCTFVIGWSTLPNPLRDASVTRSFQEIPWFSSAYLTPLFYWLVWAGIGLLFWRGYRLKEFFLLTTTLLLGALLFHNYTSAQVYPVSMRRLLSDLWPLMTIVAALALREVGALGQRREPSEPWRNGGWYAAGALGIVALGWMLWLSWPLLPQREAKGSLAFVEQLHADLPAQSVFFFENQDEDSWIGWLAAPLYSFYGDWALRLDSDEPDRDQLAQAVAEFRQGGRTVYLVSQHNPPPATLLPTGYTAILTMERVWQSTLIGQTRAPYPPPYWEFAHPVYLFRLE